ncbi:MAG: carbohydrate ABC transporter permease [Burkholderiaceae bacterium]
MSMNYTRFRGSRVIAHLALAIGAIPMLLPFVQMISTSLKSSSDIARGGLSIVPREWAAIENYRAALDATPLLHFMANGVIVTATIFVLQLVIALPCAYALAKLRWWGRDTVFAVVLFCLLIPPHAIAVPVYILFHWIGILDSYAALIVPWTISVFGIFLMRQFFLTVPDDLVDAARMDGMSELAIVWRVMLPTALPAVTAFGIFSVIAHWNDYFWPLIVLSSQAYYTPPLGVATFRTAEVGYVFGPLMAAAAIIIAPLVIAFLLAQRRFIEGIAFTGMK